MESLKTEDLTIAVEEGDTVTCTWKGRSVQRNPGETLNPFFEKLLGAASDKKKPVHMHFETLDHFNSSTISTLIRLIQAARANQVPLEMVYDGNLKWQRLSFEALRVFDKNDDMFKLRSVS